MKDFNTLIDETLHVKDLEELESAADLFHFGLENNHYNAKQTIEFNHVYWKMKNMFLTYECTADIKASQIDLISIVTSAPSDIKEDKEKLGNYVKNRIKAMKGNGKERF